MENRKPTVSLGIPKREFFEIEHLGSVYFLEVARTEEQLAEAKALDDLAFGSHLGITMEELVEIMNHGEVVLLRNEHGLLIGETQIITSPTTHHPNLPPNEAYDFGTAVHPKYQNRGLSQLLFKAQEIVALEAGKVQSTLTVRVENAKSIRARFKAGYQVTEYHLGEYSSENDEEHRLKGARLIMVKNHVRPNDRFAVDTLVRTVDENEVTIVSPSNMNSAVQAKTPLLGVVIQSGDNVDYDAHRLVAPIFATEEYAGIGLLKISETNSSSKESERTSEETRIAEEIGQVMMGAEVDEPSLLILKHKDALLI